MKKIAIILSILLLLVIGVISIWSADNDGLNKIGTVAKALQGFCNVATLVIAVLLYEKYGMDEPIKEKQLDVVLKCLEKSKKVFVFFEGQITGGGGSVISFRPAEQAWHEFSEFDNQPLLFHHSYFVGMRGIEEITEDLYFPTELKPHIPFLSTPVMTSVNEKERVGYFVASCPIREMNEDKTKIGKVWKRELKISNIKLMWKTFINEQVAWINSHSNNKVELNILK
ncbi:MAG: hypothetical protein JWO30_840 [Fibrobacteres bacterium]|nr:hypothetical protein [Fibrobacterota bacterium]